MGYKRFPNPVRVIFQQSQECVISSAFDAVEFMRGWPGNRSGRLYRIALQHCLDALDGMLSVKTAHASFMAAAREAGILLVAPKTAPVRA